MQARGPNFLLVMSDQHRADAIGVEGRGVRTPHLDLLAAQGTRFSACITPNVVCMPARASVLTGLLPLTHGTHDNGIDLDPDAAQRGFAGTLAAAGYRTAFFGKAHFSSNHSAVPTGRCENVRSSSQFADDWFGPYMGFEHVELMQLGHNYWLPEPAPGGLHYERWYHRDGQGARKNALYAQRLAPVADAAQTHNSALPTAWHNSTWTGDRAVEFLRARGRGRAQGDGTPFCAWVSFADPHHPFDAPAPWCWMHNPADIVLPRRRTRDLDRRPWWHRAALESVPGGTPENRKVRQEYSRIAPQSDDQLRQIIANYFGMISLVDHQVGRILGALDDEGLAENTVVVFCSDHGDWLGDHGLVLKGPMFYEGLLRVPLLLRGPGIDAGRVVSDPVSTLDIAASFADWAATPMAAAAHSRSLRALARGEGTRDFATSEWRLGPARTGVALDLRAVRSRHAKLTYEFGSRTGEMYDLREDPDECENLFEVPSARGLRDELMDMLMARPDDILQKLPEPVGPA